MLQFPIIAGMPVPLPTHLTQDNLPHVEALDPVVDVRLQAVSFFLFVFLLSALAVRWLWNRGWVKATNSAKLSYSSALLITFAWGMASVVILTMISGARELMTPGAWQQQGWTYKLAEETSSQAPDSQAARKAALTELRFHLFRYAAQNDGKFPDSKDAIGEKEIWKIPQHPGFNFLLRAEQSATGEAKVLVMEPEIDQERFVIMTNGLIGSMTSEDINRELNRNEQ